VAVAVSIEAAFVVVWLLLFDVSFLLIENRFRRFGPLILSSSNVARLIYDAFASLKNLQMFWSFGCDILSFLVSKLALRGEVYRSIDLKMSADLNV